MKQINLKIIIVAVCLVLAKGFGYASAAIPPSKGFTNNGKKGTHQRRLGNLIWNTLYNKVKKGLLETTVTE
uniref:Uncharacterized protein n=1 Tax=Megaselia scalaris TaxID=36166 RepID=T1GKA6_MEGSC